MRHQRQPFVLRLRDEEAFEGVGMMAREGRNALHVREGHRQL
jgi:hypothetical protein